MTIWNHKPSCMCRGCHQKGIRWAHPEACRCRVCVPLPVEERLWRKVVRGQPDTCWLWKGSRDKGGYGRILHGKRIDSAHRVAWTVTNGPVPDGLWVLHRCDNPACVNPSHLFLGTRTDNVRDMFVKGRGNSANARKTHCPKGHEYDAKNTGYAKSGARRCRACDRAQHSTPECLARKRQRRVTSEPRV